MDLEAMEHTTAAEVKGVDDDSELMLHPKSKPKRKQNEADKAWRCCSCRLKESSKVIQSLAAAQTDPVVNQKRSSIANYVKDNLLYFPERKYKQAKSTITKLIMDLEEDDTEDDEHLPVGFGRGDGQASSSLQPQPVYPQSSCGSSSSSSSQCEF